MSLDTTQSQSAAPISVFADDFPNWAMLCIGSDVPTTVFAKNGVLPDVERWLRWMLYGGCRPSANKRSIHAEGVNTIAAVQNFLCRMLDASIGQLDFDNPVHFALIERATRPLPPVYNKHRHARDES